MKNQVPQWAEQKHIENRIGKAVEEIGDDFHVNQFKNGNVRIAIKGDAADTIKDIQTRYGNQMPAHMAIKNLIEAEGVTNLSGSQLPAMESIASDIGGMIEEKHIPQQIEAWDPSNEVDRRAERLYKNVTDGLEDLERNNNLEQWWDSNHMDSRLDTIADTLADDVNVGRDINGYNVAITGELRDTIDDIQKKYGNQVPVDMKIRELI